MKSLLLILLAAVTFQNPILYADYSDPDAIRVGNDYYMTASSFNCYPGLQILHSTDLVNWSLVNAALPKAYDKEKGVEHGNFVWAPSLRFHNGLYYIFWGDPDRGIYYTTTKDVRGRWSDPQLLLEGKGYIDPCPYWQNDTLYVIHALAGSRAGLKSVLLAATFVDNQLSDHRIIFDGHQSHPTCEGPKIYKRNDFYYIFTPAGGVATGWQLVLRSKNIYGPYEEKIVLKQGSTDVNGPHQGAWVTTPSGEDWFLHFQDVGALGRIVHLQPMKWENDWPIMGNNGEPVSKYKAPEGCKKQIKTSNITIEFDSTALDYSWQYPHTPDVKWHFCDANSSMLRLFSMPENDGNNLWEQPNLLLRKIDAPKLTATAKVRFSPATKINGERCGLITMGLDYAGIMIEKRDNRLIVYTIQCTKANKKQAEQLTSDEIAILPDEWVYLRLKIEKGIATFALSTNNKSFITIGIPFTLKEGQWIGAKYGFYCTRPSLKTLKSNKQPTNDGGHLDIDWLKIEY